MANPSLYASREGALYQSYDNYAGASGFYDPSQDQQTMPADTGMMPMDQMQMQPAQHQQQTFAQFYQQQAPSFQPVAVVQPQYSAPQYMSYSAQPMQQPMQPMQAVQHYQPVAAPVAAGTVQVVNVPRYAQPQQQMPIPTPVAYGAQLRGVGIKFGERIDPRSGGMLVYVKRLVKGGPADQCGRIQPGDVLQLINAEDIYGQGLDILRDKIPGPAGTTVKLGFRSYAGQLYEVDLARTAYGDQPPEGPPAAPQSGSAQYAYAPPQPVVQQQQRMVMVPAQHQQYVQQVPQQPQYVMAPRQYVQQPQQPMQYYQRPAVQYVAAPRQPVEYQQVQYQPQMQYQPIQQPVPQVQYQQQPPVQQVQYQQAMPPQQQYQPQQQQYQQQQQQYQPHQPTDNFLQPYNQQYQPQQQYAQAPPQQAPQQQLYSQPQAQQHQPAYGDYADPNQGYGDYAYAQNGEEHLQGTQV